MADRTEELQVALEAVRLGARLCSAAQGEVGAHTKADASPVTVADFGSQALIGRALLGSFPDDPLVGEESADALRSDPELARRVRERVADTLGEAVPEADLCAWVDHGAHRETPPRFWTTDPIDGTKGFLRDMSYAVAVALVEDGRPVVSAVACPRLTHLDGTAGAVFFATEGGGAWTEPLSSPGVARRLAVSTRPPAEGCFVESYEPRHSDQDRSAAIVAAVGITNPPLRIDSMAKYALVARGEADLYLRVKRPGYRENVWDHAPGMLLVLEAGGRVTDFTGAPPRFDLGCKFAAEGGLVVSSGRWHDQVLAAV